MLEHGIFLLGIVSWTSVRARFKGICYVEAPTFTAVFIIT
jgi:hypothetical protein